jgi:hypothetical protein
MLSDRKEIRARRSGHLSSGMRYRSANMDSPTREHAVHAHHRGVAVVRSQCCSDFVVRDDWQVDQEAEDPGTDEVPEANRD